MQLLYFNHNRIRIKISRQMCFVMSSQDFPNVWQGKWIRRIRQSTFLKVPKFLYQNMIILNERKVPPPPRAYINKT